CALAEPQCELFFHLFGEAPPSDALDIHLFAAAELAPGSVSTIESLLKELGQPCGPVWVPVWKFRDDATRQEVEGRLNALLVRARPTPLLVATADWLHFEGCWDADVPAPRRPDFRTPTP